MTTRSPRHGTMSDHSFRQEQAARRLAEVKRVLACGTWRDITGEEVPLTPSLRARYLAEQEKLQQEVNA